MPSLRLELPQLRLRQWRGNVVDDLEIDAALGEQRKRGARLAATRIMVDFGFHRSKCKVWAVRLEPRQRLDAGGAGGYGSGDVGSLRYNNDKMFRALLTLSALGVAGCVSAPPVQEMSDARQAISAAEQADAGRLAADTLADARRFLEDAERQIQEEAYGPARMNAVRAKNRAVQALRSTQPRAGADD